MAFLWTICGGDGDITSMAISPAQVQHSRPLDSDAVTVPQKTPPTAPLPGGPSSPAGAERVRWPQPPQDTVIQDAPAARAVPAVAPGRWSGRRTAAVAALALALTSAGALAAAAATPNGISGPTEQRGGGAGFGAPGNRQLGRGGGQPGQQLGPQPGAQQGQQGQQPGAGVPGPGRGNH